MDKILSNIIPEEYAYDKKVFPLDATENTLTVMMESFDLSLINELKIMSARNVKVKISKKDAILENIAQYYRSAEYEKNRGEIIFENILDDAVASRASDIHIEPYKDYARVRKRVDGELIEFARYSNKEYLEISTIIKLKAGCDITEKRLPQDGRFTVENKDYHIDIRLSSIAVVYGEKIEMRILDRNNFFKNRRELGFSEKAIETIDSAINKESGMLIITGSTGSGKSSTVYSIINEIKNRDINITTIEDPVEYMIDGVNQIPVNSKAGLRFDNGLRAILRQDPDCIVIGEIRDKETAQIAVRASITGHLVITSLHTSNAVSAITRLKDMGLEPYKITASLTAIVHQKLIKEKDSKDKKSRKLVYEILTIDDEIKKYIKSSCDEKLIEKIAKKNGRILKEWKPRL